MIIFLFINSNYVNFKAIPMNVSVRDGNFQRGAVNQLKSRMFFDVVFCYVTTFMWHVTLSLDDVFTNKLRNGHRRVCTLHTNNHEASIDDE